MQNNLNYAVVFNSNVDKVLAAVNRLDNATINIGKSVTKVDNAFVKMVGNINKKLSSVNIASLVQNINSALDGIGSFSQPGLELSTSLSDLSAITGVTGDKLKEIENNARDSAKAFGGSAAQGVESYKLLLSQLTPELGKAPKALGAMGKSVAILSKTMKGDTQGATEVLTTAMNQYKVSTEDPIKASKEMSRMMNIMAAAAKEGSAELPQQKAALEQSGMAAKAAKLKFEEHAAAIQVLDKAGKKGSEGGVALRNTLATLAQGRFLPKEVREELESAEVDINTLSNTSLSFTERLKPLKKIMGDTALMSKLFGKENTNAALALVGGIENQERLKKAIVGTNTAYEQAAIIMESPAEKNARLKAKVDDFKISLFNTSQGLMGYASIISDVGRDVGNMIPLFAGFSKIIQTVTNAEKIQVFWTKILTAKQWLLNTAMNANPIGLIIIGITALIAVITAVVMKYDEWGAALTLVLGPLGLIINLIQSFRRHWDSVKKAFEEGGMIAGIKRVGMVILDALLMPVQQLLEILNKVPGLEIAGDGAKWIEDTRRGLELLPNDEVVQVTAAERGIKPPKVPGTTEGTGGEIESEKSKEKKLNKTIATGGSKNNYITLNITKEMIGSVVIKGRDFKDSAKQMEEQLTDGLLRTLALATTAGV